MEASKDMEVLIRYVIPGYTLLLPIALITYFINPGISEVAGLLLIVFGLCIGYFLQQIYMYCFEGKGWPFEAGGYTSVDRGGRRKIMEKVAEGGQTLTKTQAYNIWEYFILTEQVKGIRRHISRLHAFIHSQRTVALACIIGALASVSGIPLLMFFGKIKAWKALALMVVSVSYALLALLLLLKAKQIRETLMGFEEFIVKKHWDDITGLLKSAEYLHETGKKK
ncbi:MAG: hypothetical protein ABH834_04500 [Candidatus Altiarchaeota archaeon]